MDIELYQRLLRDPLATTIDYYAQCLPSSPKAIEYLERMSLSSDAALKVGCGDRTLGTRIPSKTTKAGRELRQRLHAVGVLKDNGRETLRGMLTVPLESSSGQVTGIFGKRIDRHSHEPGQVTLGCGIFNAQALNQYDELIITDDLLDAWAFYSSGHTHVICAVTVDKRGLYVRAFALWCNQADLPSPLVITKSILEAFQRHLFRYRKSDGQPLAWSSQHLHLKEVRQFFAWLAKHNHIPFNPAAEIELPKQPKTLPKAIFSAAEVELILQQPDTSTPLGLRDRAIFEVLYSTGIRRAELCALKIDDLHVDRQVLFISQGKGQKDRYVPIGLRALLWIARYVDQARDRLAIDPKSALSS